MRAFILGAGLGKRLRPLTEHLPKPLLPVKGEPLVCRIIRRLAAAGVDRVMINTHHAHHRWGEFFKEPVFEGVELNFRHEPVLLDTGGGIKNVEDFFEGHGTFLIHNGDVFTDLPLSRALEHHRREKNLVTLVLRSSGGPLHVALDGGGRVTDIRGGLNSPGVQACLFTGIHVAEPELFRHIPQVEVKSIIPIYLDLIRRGLRVGGVVIDEGEWSDIGTLEEYRLRAA
ncbi:MAG: nucleotidyltransferase family protein [Verrucomicrobiae bacterium]|nr:nucleotidyltransferase family protein [Verrucomicrobiae bacterium]